ncbi:MAG: PQQ-dependent dehydrogenase, methanol/ethanol family [Sphingobium sp.]
MTMMKRFLPAAAMLVLVSCSHDKQDSKEAIRQIEVSTGLLDGSNGENWPAYGGTYGEQHFSPLDEVNAQTVGNLGLAWSYDLPPGNPMSGPIAVDGVLYTATGYSIVRAFDVQKGTELWSFDPEAPQAAGFKLRQGWGIRGLAYWNGKIIVGTQDGRLIGIDAHSGKQIWSVLTVGKDDYRFISGAPRVFGGKVIIGHGGADAGDTRGYVTTYDADTGKQLWRFHTVPGDPSKGFENKAMKVAAGTWAGQWWKYGGGGTVWNTFTYDPETNTIFLGTGNGAPWNYKLRSEGKGDNLFLCSVVALDADTGEYKWHYQFNPGESWDYNASMDMQLADLSIDGKIRKVLMELPKNGFFYIIDRANGELLSAEQVARVNWAKSIDLKTGRPVENPAVRFRDDKPFPLYPGPNGAHTWLPSAFSPQSKLIYLPISDIGFTYDPRGFGAGWKRPSGNLLGTGFNMGFGVDGETSGPSSAIIAWDPQARKEVWRRPSPGGWTGGILATGGGLVFQGDLGGEFRAMDARSGEILWSFDAHVPVLAPPISYRAGGRQYITVIAGIGTSAGISQYQSPVAVDYRSQPRRVLTFVLDGKASIPDYKAPLVVAQEDNDYRPDPVLAEKGLYLYVSHCVQCHGAYVKSAGTAPDLRGSPVPLNEEAFRSVVKDGILVSAGMPDFEELTEEQIASIRQFLRSAQDDLRHGR